MEKIFMTNEPGKFFDAEEADCFDGDWTTKELMEKHEAMYHTKKGSWVKTVRGVYGPNAEVEEVTPQEAAQWFTDNGYEFEKIPEDLQDYCGEEI